MSLGIYAAIVSSCSGDGTYLLSTRTKAIAFATKHAEENFCSDNSDNVEIRGPVKEGSEVCDAPLCGTVKRVPPVPQKDKFEFKPEVTKSTKKAPAKKK